MSLWSVEGLFFIALRRSFCLDSKYPQADPRCPVICHRVAYCHFPPCLCERSIGVIKALKELSSKSSGFLNNFIKCCDALGITWAVRSSGVRTSLPSCRGDLFPSLTPSFYLWLLTLHRSLCQKSLKRIRWENSNNDHNTAAAIY